MSRKISFNEFTERCNKTFNNRFYYFECTFTKMKDYIQMFDKEKNIFVKQIASRHYLGELPRASSTITFEEFLQKMVEFHGDRFEFEEDSFTSGTHSLVKFKDCSGESYEYVAAYLLKGRLPPELNPKAKNKKSHNSYDTDKVKQLILKENPYAKHFDLSCLEYKDQYTSFDIRCVIHDHVFPSTLERARRYNCPKCSSTLRQESCRKGNQYYINKFKKVHSDRYDYPSKQEIISEGFVTAICKEHNIKFTNRVQNHLKGAGCPVCHNYSSLKELDFATWINSRIKEESQRNIRPSWLVPLGYKLPCEIDIFIPSLNVGIEYNGCYHHSSVNKPITYHKDKYELCKENGITLIHVFEFEDELKWKRILSNYLKSPEEYEVQFFNNKRSYDGLEYYGQTKIIKR